MLMGGGDAFQMRSLTLCSGAGVVYVGRGWCQQKFYSK